MVFIFSFPVLLAEKDSLLFFFSLFANTRTSGVKSCLYTHILFYFFPQYGPGRRRRSYCLVFSLLFGTYLTLVVILFYPNPNISEHKFDTYLYQRAFLYLLKNVLFIR